MKSLRKTRKEQSLRSKTFDNSNFCNFPYCSLLRTPAKSDGSKPKHGPKPISYSPEFSKVILIDFAVNGRYLACINIKDSIDYQDPLASKRNLCPTSELVLLKAEPVMSSSGCENSETEQNRNNMHCGYHATYQNNDLSAVASINLNLVEVYCTEISNDTMQFAVYGFGYNTLPRKPVISVYEVHYENQTDLVSLSQKTKLVFENDEILSSKLTACKFFPIDANVLVTAMCIDYHSIRKTNYLDFWNSSSSVHFARFNLLEKAPKFQGYVTSMSFSSDGLVLALTSSSIHCQLLLYSTNTCQFGTVFSQREFSYTEQEEHFPVYSSFVNSSGDYELVICTFHGEFLRLRIDQTQLKVTSVISHIMVFNNKLNPNYLRQSSAIEAFRYCKAASRYIIRTQTELSFIDANTNILVKVIKLHSSEHSQSSNARSCFALSRTGQELAIISNNTLFVYFYQNPDFSLKNCCRESIIQLVSEDKFSQLPLPKMLKSYLLYNI